MAQRYHYRFETEASHSLRTRHVWATRNSYFHESALRGFRVLKGENLQQTHLLPTVLALFFNNNYHYIEKVSALIAEVKFQPGTGKPVSHLTGLKISHVIVLSPGCNRVSSHSLPNFQAEIPHVIENNLSLCEMRSQPGAEIPHVITIR